MISRALLAALLLALPLAAPAANEARCDEIGADCLCNEPFNANDGTVSTSTWDPSDTGESDKECNQDWGFGAWLTPDTVDLAQTIELVEDSATSSGDNLVGADWVLELEHVGGDTGLRHGNMTITGKTYCMRAYEQYSSDFPYTLLNATNDHKMVFMESAANSPHFQCIRSSSALSCHGINVSDANHLFYWSQNFSNNTWWGLSPTITGEDASTDDCISHWCRYEICLDHYTSGPNANQMRMRMRVFKLRDTGGDDALEIVGSRTLQELVSDGIGSATAVTSGNRHKLFSTQQNPSQWEPAGSWEANMQGTKRWMSHLMVALLDTDDTFWIGPAEEIEGAGAGSSTGSLLGVGGSGWGTQ